MLCLAFMYCVYPLVYSIYILLVLIYGLQRRLGLDVEFPIGNVHTSPIWPKNGTACASLLANPITKITTN